MNSTPIRQNAQNSGRNQWSMAILTVVVVAAAIVMAFIGSGALGGTSVSEAAGGALSADATPVAPASTAFSIWSVIYIGLVAYAIWQLTPSARDSERQRALRPWAMLSALLNALWLGMVQWEMILGSVLVIVVLLAVLIRIMFVLGFARPRNWIDLVVSDGTFGLYFGWVLLATVANTYAWLAAAGVEAFEDEVTGIVGIVVAAAIAVLAAVFSRGRIAPALATAWGLSWVAVARTEGVFEDEALVWTAGIAAAVVLVVAIVVRILEERRNGSRPGPEPEREPEEHAAISDDAPAAR